jgi:hypothetical protein
VVQGTGYTYPPWIGSVWYPAPATYAAAPAREGVYDDYGSTVASGARTSFSNMPAAASGTAERLTMYTNPKTGNSSAYGFVKAGNDVYADKSGLIFSNASGQWQQRSPTGWSSASGDIAWADREAQARSAGENRFNTFSQAGGQAGNGAGAGSGPSR